VREELSRESHIESVYRQVAHAFEGTPADRTPMFAAFLDVFRECSPVLDVGCGDGTFLEVMRSNGITGAGIDLDPVKVKQCSEKGFDVELADLRDLEQQGRQFGGIMASHIIEHVEPRAAIEFFLTAFALLRSGGRLALLTPNIGFQPVIENFWLDLTHVRPYPRALLVAMLQACGFAVIGNGVLGGMQDTYVVAQRP
jgi:2-polyprenyl-3-methyl-5-hydroxy-6-metoxy-1,4-benzoquinol methylase